MSVQTAGITLMKVGGMWLSALMWIVGNDGYLEGLGLLAGNQSTQTSSKKVECEQRGVQLPLPRIAA